MRGTNRLVLSQEAMCEILAEWLTRRTTLSCGVRVVDFGQAIDDPRCYEVTIEEVKHATAKKA